MKRNSLTRRDRRTLIVGACMIVSGLLIRCVGVSYVHALASLRAQIAKARSDLGRERQAIQRMPVLPAARTVSARRLDVELDRLFQRNNAFLATADLAQYVVTMSQSDGLQLQASETELSRVVAPGVQALQIDIRAEGDLDGILHFLHHLESGGKLVRVGALSISAGARPALGGGRGAVVGGDRDDISGTRQVQGIEVLSLAASVYGYRLDASLREPPAAQAQGAPSPFTASHLVYSQGVLNRALEHDLFSPTRTRPVTSYVMALANVVHPGIIQAGNSTPYQQPNLHLIGAVVDTDGDGSFIYYRNGGAPIQMVHVGENVAGYTLASVDRDGAVLTMSNGARIVLPLQQVSVESHASDRLRRSHHPTADNVSAPGTSQPSVE